MYQNNGPTEIRTQITGFRNRDANHYTIEPCNVSDFIFLN